MCIVLTMFGSLQIDRSFVTVFQMFSGSLTYIRNMKRPREVGRECNSKIFVVTRPGKEVAVSKT